MDLQNFVASTLVQIVQGMKEAQRQLADTGACVNPGHGQAPGQSGRSAVRDQRTWNETQDIAFDIAVTAAEGSETGGTLGIRVLAAQIGGGRGTTQESGGVSRVKFVVPLSMPIGRRQETSG